MKLYYASGACSLAPHIALCEINVEFTIESVDLKTKLTEEGKNFLEINPRGQVPTLLLDDGSTLTEVSAILQYIADQDQSQNLIPPAGTFERYKAIEWLSYLSTELHKNFSPLFAPPSPEGAKYVEAARKKLHTQFTNLNQKLSGYDYLLNNKFSVIDMYLFVILGWSGMVGLDLNPYRELVAFMKRVNQHNSVRQARLQEGLPEFCPILSVGQE